MTSLHEDPLEERNLSHHQEESSFETRFQKIRDKIIQRNDLTYVTVERQLELLDMLKEFDLGQFFIERAGLNGYWTYRVVSFPTKPNVPLANPVEEFIFTKAPVFLATQQRYQIFKYELQKRVKEGAVFASIPCGLMADLLELDFSKASDFTLTGIDIDIESLKSAELFAKKQGLSDKCEFLLKDAWDLNIENHFDVLTSNGLTIYEPSDDKVIELYSQFFRALKPGGYLITSFLTPPPLDGRACEWILEKIRPEDALMQKIIFSDILGIKWQVFRSTETVKKQLEKAGFIEIEFIRDEASLFPTVIAHKPSV